MSYRAGVALKLKIFSCRLRISCSFPSFDEFKSSYWYLYLNLLNHKVVHNNHHLPVKKMWIEKNFIREWFQFFLHSNCIYLGRLKHHEKPRNSQNNGSGLRIPLWTLFECLFENIFLFIARWSHSSTTNCTQKQSPEIHESFMLGYRHNKKVIN